MNLEELKFITNRFDTYFELANNKGNFYIGYNLFVLSGALAFKKEFLSSPNNNYWLTFFLLVLSAICCLSIFLVT